MIEEVVHLIYAQTHAEWGYQFAVGFLGVAVGANGFPILIQFLIYRGLYHRDDKWVTASTRWWPLELASGLSWLFLFGAGLLARIQHRLERGAAERAAQCRGGASRALLLRAQAAPGGRSRSSWTDRHASGAPGTEIVPI